MSKFKEAVAKMKRPEVQAAPEPEWVPEEKKEETKAVSGNGEEKKTRAPKKVYSEEERAAQFKNKGNLRLASAIRAIRSLRSLSSQRFNMYSDAQIQKAKESIEKELATTVTILEQRGLKARAPIESVL